MSEEINLHGTMDAEVWAAEFMRLFGHRLNEVDDGLMISWFANAIMCGHDHAMQRKEESQQRALTLAREALEPFSDKDFQEAWGGNVEGDDSIIYQRGGAKLTLGDFRKAAMAIAALDELGVGDNG